MAGPVPLQLSDTRNKYSPKCSISSDCKGLKILEKSQVTLNMISADGEQDSHWREDSSQLRTAPHKPVGARLRMDKPPQSSLSRKSLHYSHEQTQFRNSRSGRKGHRFFSNKVKPTRQTQTPIHQNGPNANRTDSLKESLRPSPGTCSKGQIQVPSVPDCQRLYTVRERQRQKEREG